MSDFLSLLRTRRSIRRFRPIPIEAEKIELLREALLRAPSSRGKNPWEFTFITDPALLKQLSQAKAHGSEFLARAPLAVVVAADPERCDVWVEDCAIAAILLQLAAHSLGLGSCWAQIRLRPHGHGGSAEEFVRATLNLPQRLAVACIIGIGYAGEAKKGHSLEELPWKQVHDEDFFRIK